MTHPLDNVISLDDFKKGKQTKDSLPPGAMRVNNEGITFGEDLTHIPFTEMTRIGYSVENTSNGNEYNMHFFVKDDDLDTVPVHTLATTSLEAFLSTIIVIGDILHNYPHLEQSLMTIKKR